jgi:hypothetical protein
VQNKVLHPRTHKFGHRAVGSLPSLVTCRFSRPVKPSMPRPPLDCKVCDTVATWILLVPRPLCISRDLPKKWCRFRERQDASSCTRTGEINVSPERLCPPLSVGLPPIPVSDVSARVNNVNASSPTRLQSFEAILHLCNLPNKCYGDAEWPQIELAVPMSLPRNTLCSPGQPMSCICDGAGQEFEAATFD